LENINENQIRDLHHSKINYYLKSCYIRDAETQLAVQENNTKLRIMQRKEYVADIEVMEERNR
jgi:hypothetical protein